MLAAAGATDEPDRFYEAASELLAVKNTLSFLIDGWAPR